jgi:ADP-heptose:LPS heptosyltransferase
MAGGIVAGVRRIAVLRANAIGDLMFALPALAAIKAAYPDAELCLLAKPWHADFLSGRPGPVDRVIVVPPAPGVTIAAGDEPADRGRLERFFADMGDERFDLGIQMHGGGRWSNPFVRRLGARLTAGLQAEGTQPLDRCVRYIFYHREVLRYLEVASAVGADPAGLEPKVAVTAADLAESAGALGGVDRPLAILNPGAGDPRRRWPAHRFAEVGDVLVSEGCEVVVSGDATDEALASTVVARMASPARSLAGRLSLGGLAGLLSRAAVVVSNDSGPLHLAQAVGASTVGVYWCGNAITAGPTTSDRHRSVLSWQLGCLVCGRDNSGERCEHDPSFVSDVPVETVVDQALDLLHVTG